MSPTPVDGATSLMGVIGDPVCQVKTPQLINPIFADLGANILCVPIRIPVPDLPSAWRGMKAMGNLIGFGVTLPHKRQVLPLCDSLDQEAERVGAVNVVRRETDGSFRGYQFDGTGFLRGLMAQGHDPRGMDCLILGAGGAAAAVAFKMLDAGVTSLTIVNRTASKAESLAAYLNRQTGDNRAVAAPAPSAGHELVINATSLGLRDDDPLPLPADSLRPDMLVADVIANPEITRFLEVARARGAAVHPGTHMVRNQVDLIARHLIEVLV